MKKHLFCATLSIWSVVTLWYGKCKIGKASLDEVVNAMTLEEKAHLIIGTGMAGFSGDSAVIGETRKLVPGAAGTITDRTSGYSGCGLG